MCNIYVLFTSLFFRLSIEPKPIKNHQVWLPKKSQKQKKFNIYYIHIIAINKVVRMCVYPTRMHKRQRGQVTHPRLRLRF